MNNRRVSRISTEIKRVISQLIIDSIKDPRVNELVTITDVEVTNDLSFAKVYVGVFGDDEAKEAALEGLENAKGFIKRELGQKIELRHIPELIFEIDETIEQGNKIESLIREINKGDK